MRQNKMLKALPIANIFNTSDGISYSEEEA